MKNLQIPTKFKVKSEDFIVEEITKDEKICKISKKWDNKEILIPEKSVESKREFIWCEFEKKDIDQFRSLKEFASSIRKGLDSIGFAGTKDKKAWTCQQISIFKPNLEVLKNFSHPNIHLKNLTWEKRKIKLGYLKGNQFTVTLREIDKKEAIKITSQIKKTTQFPNYFGKQRFGSVRENNDKIGKLILKRDFKKAIFTILTEISPNEREEVQKARQKLIKDKNFKEALKYFPIFLKFERSLLDYLSRNKEDYLGTIKKIERKQFLMYIHALQSKIFNEILEKALEQGINFNIKGQQKIPLFGYKSKIDSGKLGKIEKEILENHNINLSEFDIKEIPFLRIKGDLRNALINVENLEVETQDDELFEGTKKIILKFKLPSGVYATTFLNNFFILIENEKRN